MAKFKEGDTVTFRSPTIYILAMGEVLQMIREADPGNAFLLHLTA